MIFCVLFLDAKFSMKMIFVYIAIRKLPRLISDIWKLKIVLDYIF